MGWPHAALFDLDGTLIDSVPDIAEALAELMATDRLDSFSPSEVAAMVGHGIRTTVSRAYAARGVPLDGTALDAKVATMMTIYPRHLIEKTVVMPGVAPALDVLAAEGVVMAVVTNKPQLEAEKVLGHFGLARHFAIVLGDDPAGPHVGLPRKPAPDRLLYVLQRLAVAPDAAIMVGDSGPDIQSGKAGHIFSIGVRGGYAIPPLEDFAPDLIIDTMADLPRALDRQGRATRAGTLRRP